MHSGVLQIVPELDVQKYHLYRRCVANLQDAASCCSTMLAGWTVQPLFLLLPADLSLTVKVCSITKHLQQVSAFLRKPARRDGQAPDLPSASWYQVSARQPHCSRLCASCREGRKGRSLTGCTASRLMLLSFFKPCLARQAAES